ncbi:MAG TPA: glucose-6-phosphate isomerase [Verrucomicrobiae bacterium]|nr:glucose-6-phosphate isomerase [Verrucomicrobiae bacterium]
MASPEKFSWEHFQKWYFEYPRLGFALDLSRVNFPDGFLESMEPRMQQAFAAMDALEKGAIANPDEKRMVGHYWLRNPALAPTQEIRDDITRTVADIKAFAGEINRRKEFDQLLLIGIGGSALGPQFVSRALARRMPLHVFDNTDPDGMQHVLNNLELKRTLVLVISKSGGTKETRNGMLEAEAAFRQAGFDFATHAVAVTGVGSELDKVASKNGWLRRFPMWDWVGGRTSETSAVGLLPAALQGIDIEALIDGARSCDLETRDHNMLRNPAALLALAWHVIVNGVGSKDMVILPYKDSLELLSRYLQQLVMESLGKELDLSGNPVNQGLSVFGNKGSTDQHAYIQQLRDGINNFFAMFIRVLSDSGKLQVEDGATTGDYLDGFYQGTRQALAERNRQSITLTLKVISPFSIGLLIALFERAVGFYASLVNVNAYHQPGVEAGKKAAENVLALQRKIVALLPARELTVEQIAGNLVTSPETVFHICEHLVANNRLTKSAGPTPFAAKYGLR